MNHFIINPIYSEIVGSLRQYPQGGVMVLAQGLSIPSIVSELLSHFLERRTNLIFLINFNQPELIDIESILTLVMSQNSQLGNELYAQSIIRASKLTTDKRKQFYLAGGIISITAQVLSQDLLGGVLDPRIITHIIITRVHSVNHKCHAEAFCANLIKGVNPSNFFIGFTDQPQLTVNNIQDIVRPLYARDVFLWPFNRVEILSQVAQDKYSWEDHKVSMRKSELAIQDALLILVEECVQELNRRTGGEGLILRTSTILHTPKAKLIKFLEKMRQRYARLTQMQIFMDLFSLKKLLFQLVDSSSAYYLTQIQNVISQADMESIFYVCDSTVEKAVQSLTDNAKLNVLSLETLQQPKEFKFPLLKQNENEKTKNWTTLQLKYDLKINLKANRKLVMLTQILKKYKENIEDNPENRRVWVWTKHPNNQEKIQTFLTNFFKLGDEDDILYQMHVLKNHLNESLKNQKPQYTQLLNEPKRLTDEIPKAQKNQKKKQEKDIELSFLFLLHQELEDFFLNVQEIQQSILFQTHKKPEKQKTYQLLPDTLLKLEFTHLHSEIDDEGLLKKYDENTLIPGLTVVINSLDDPSSRAIFLRDYKPNMVIVCDPTTSFLRELMLESQDIEVHALFYQNSIESQTFYKDKLDEDKAFDDLTDQCSKMPIFEEKPSDQIEQLKITSSSNQTTRVGKGESFFTEQNILNSKPTIIVDFRDFRSELPAYLHYAGFQVVPMMLKTGDYVLSNNVIIERKAVETGDFNDSVIKKRIHEQLKRLSEFQYPFLLIEYSERIEFNIESLGTNNYFFQRQDNGEKIQPNKYRLLMSLVQILQQFPKVQLLWAQSAWHSAKIIKRLKQTIAQTTPDLEQFRKMAPKESDLPDLTMQLTTTSQLENIVI